MTVNKDRRRIDDVDEWVLLLGVAGLVLVGAVALFASVRRGG